MTWRELFLRVWLFLRAHLKRQHMCPECGDACVKVYSMHAGCEGAWWWECEVCEEERQIKRSARGFGLHAFNDIAKQHYIEQHVSYPIPMDYDDSFLRPFQHSIKAHSK